MIYPYLTENVSQSNGARGIFFDFRMGIDGPIKNIGRRGKNLEKILKDDPAAMAEFRTAYKVHRRRKRLCDFLEYFGYAVAGGSAVALFAGLDKDAGSASPGVALGAAGIVAGITEIIVFHKRSEKHTEAFVNSIAKSIQIYNTNLLAKTN